VTPRKKKASAKRKPPARKKKAAKKAPTKKRPPGRPRDVMTDATIEGILTNVRLGFPPDRAARAEGIDPAAMRKHKQRHPEFVTALEKAEAEAERGYLSRIIQASEKNWTAAAWVLERRWPQTWAKRDPDVQVNVDARPAPSGPPGGNWSDYLDRLAEVSRSLERRNGVPPHAEDDRA
jgi:hypothetical protein